ncbi:ATP-binding protein [Actinomycetes bacterium M1A6_2h]
MRTRFGKLDNLRWSIRARSAAAAMAVVAVTLGVGGSVLVAVLHSSAVAALDSAASTRIRDITSSLEQDSPAELDAVVLATDQNVAVVQIIDNHGLVVRGSITAPSAPIIPEAQTMSNSRTLSTTTPNDEDIRVTTASARSIAGPVTVVVASDLSGVGSTISRVTLLLLAGTPVVVAVAGAATFLLVGRSLRSVERIRRRVSEISAANLGERLPVSNRRDEITALAETMNEMLARVDSALAAQRRFVSDASHELRSPLTTVGAALELGLKNNATDRTLLKSTLQPEVRRMQDLVDNLLVLARSDERGLPLRVEDVDLDDIAHSEVSLLRDRSAHEVRACLRPTRVRGDHAALTRVLRNLVVNASRHATSVIEIDVGHGSRDAYLTVGDDGPGIAEADRTRVFDRFVRLEDHRARTSGGSGLGLAIVAEIVSAHGGSVDITDRVGGGTVVWVTLPFAASSRLRRDHAVSDTS